MLSLISGGTGDDSFLSMMTPDGKDIFFTTWDRLTWSDTDAAQDIYTARIGGGIAPPPVTPSCSGDGCQGEGASPPSAPAVGSASLRGKGNAVSSDRRASGKFSARAKVRGAKATLRVRAPKAGRITVTGRSVRQASVKVGEAGVRTLRLKLTPKAKRALDRRSTLNTRVRVRFVAGDGAKSSKSVWLKLRSEGRR